MDSEYEIFIIIFSMFLIWIFKFLVCLLMSWRVLFFVVGFILLMWLLYGFCRMFRVDGLIYDVGKVVE